MGSRNRRWRSQNVIIARHAIQARRTIVRVLTNAVLRRVQRDTELSDHQDGDRQVPARDDSADHRPRLAPNFNRLQSHYASEKWRSAGALGHRVRGAHFDLLRLSASASSEVALPVEIRGSPIRFGSRTSGRHRIAVANVRRAASLGQPSLPSEPRQVWFSRSYHCPLRKGFR